MNYNNVPNNKTNKIDFIKKKENMVCSLYEVEKFLHRATNLAKGFKIYSLFK